MNNRKKLDNLKIMLNDIYTPNEGPHEGAFNYINDLIKKDRSLLGYIKEQFFAETDHDKKSCLASIAVQAGERGEFKEYLIKYDEWDESDFDS